MAPLTRADIYHQIEEGNHVLKRLHDQLACLDRAEATRLDARITQAESDLALLVAQRADLPNAAGTSAPPTPARRAAQIAPANAPLSAAATPPQPSPRFTLGYSGIAFVHTSIRQLVPTKGIKDNDERSTVSRAAHAAKAYFRDQTLRGALGELGSTRDHAARGSILNLVDTMRGSTVRNPDHVWPSVHVYEQSQARASKRVAGCSDGSRFNGRDPDDYNDDNNSNNNNGDVKIKPTPRSAGRSTSNNSGRSSRSTQRQRGHAYSATFSSSDGFEVATHTR